jgi:hypothetical protein
MKDEELKLYTEAAKVDFLKILGAETLGVHELRRIQNLAKAMVDFVNSSNTFYEKDAYGTLMRDTSDEVAPTLHTALVDRTFDGEAALRDAYVAVLEKYSELRGSAMEVESMHKALTAGPDRRIALAKELGLSGDIDEVLERARAFGEGSAPEPKNALGSGEKDDDG